MLWFSRLDPRTRFNSWAVRVRLLMDKVALRQVSLRVLRFFPRDIIPPMLLLTVICTLVSQERQRVRVGNPRKSDVISQIASVGWERNFACFYSSSDVIAPHRHVEWIFHPESEMSHAFEIIVFLEMRKRELCEATGNISSRWLECVAFDVFVEWRWLRFWVESSW